jgi:hypothetical protein
MGPQEPAVPNRTSVATLHPDDADLNRGLYFRVVWNVSHEFAACGPHTCWNVSIESKYKCPNAM